MEKLEEIVVSVVSIEKSQDPENYLRVTFGGEYPQYGILIPNDSASKHDFNFEEEYDAVVKISGMPDFVGDDTVCTMSSKILKITNNLGNIVYESKD
jgi:hypothetical protein